MARTKSLERIEEKMEGLENDSVRHRILESVKNFKTSWIELGQALYSVWRDKLYKQWGYSKFDYYTSKEIGIKKQTAMKLLRSYYFLEKEEPAYLDKGYTKEADAAKLPNYEAVDVLRMAKNKKTLDYDDYRHMKKNVFEKGKDAAEVKKELTSLIKEREELEPEEAREKRKQASLKRMVSTLKNLKRDVETLKFLPASTLKEIDSLISKIEREIS